MSIDSENTQLTQAYDPETGEIFDPSTMVFGEPQANNITLGDGKKITFYRIQIGVRNEDGTIGELVFQTEKLFSYGVQPNTNDRGIVDGYSMPLCLHNRDGATTAQRKWIEGFTNVLADGSYSDYRDPLLSRRVKLRMRKIEELKRENPECEARARIVRDGTDPLHLRDHLFDDYSLSFSSEVDAAKNQVEVHLKQHLFSGHPSVYFFSALNEIKREYASRFSRQLPSYDVDFEEIGYLGSYRISPMTGLWYTGSHYLHLVGSVQNDDDLIEAPVNMWALDPLDPPHM